MEHLIHRAIRIFFIQALLDQVVLGANAEVYQLTND
jgi:hypothetical protein